MKKVLAILLTLALLLGMTSAVLAEDEWLDVTNCWQLKYAQEHFGDPNKIKLEFVSYARWTEGELLTTALAGGTAPDICVTYNGGLVQQCIDDEGIWQLDSWVKSCSPTARRIMTVTELPNSGTFPPAASAAPTSATSSVKTG